MAVAMEVRILPGPVNFVQPFARSPLRTALHREHTMTSIRPFMQISLRATRQALDCPHCDDQPANWAAEEGGTQSSNATALCELAEARIDMAFSRDVQPPMSSLTRLAYSVQPAARLARSAGGGRSGGSLPGTLSSAVVVVVTVGTAVLAALKSKMRAVRECRACHGYGVQRCKLCSGRGTIEWEGKMAHREPCPLCLGRRLNKCTCCGGGAPLLTRSLFVHKQSDVEAALLEQLQSLASGPGENAWGKKRRSGRGSFLPTGFDLFRRRGREEDDRLEQLDQLAEQIMMD